MSLSLSGNCLSCGSSWGLEVLLPHLTDVAVERVDRLPGLVRISVRARGEVGICRRCGAGSSRVHSRYTRRLADAAIGGQRVVIRLTVRRFFCDVPGCPASTFAEQVQGLTTAYARRTPQREERWKRSLWRWRAGPGHAWRARSDYRRAGRRCYGWSAPCPILVWVALLCSGSTYPEPGIIPIIGRADRVHAGEGWFGWR